MTSDLPHVGIVTVTYNSARDLPGFFVSLREQERVRLSLYAVDNASTDDSAALIRHADLGAVRKRLLVPSINVGIAAGNNLGIAAALEDEVDWVLLLNNDTEFAPGTVASLVEAASRSGAAILSPVIEAIDPPGGLWFGGGRMIPWQGFRQIHIDEGTPAAKRVTRDPTERTDYAPTCCLLVKPEVFTKVGMMDPSYFVYYDDSDFCIRCRRAGIDYHVTSRARLLHKAGASTGGTSAFSLKWVARNWVLQARRHVPRRQLVFALAYIYARTTVAHLRRGYSLRDQVRWFWAGLTWGLACRDVPAADGRERLSPPTVITEG